MVDETAERLDGKEWGASERMSDPEEAVTDVKEELWLRDIVNGAVDDVSLDEDGTPDKVDDAVDETTEGKETDRGFAELDEVLATD